MMLKNSIKRAYETLDSRNWDKIYIALDLHDTVMESNYKDAHGGLLEIAIEPLRVISNLPEVSIILYSCCHEKDYNTYIELLRKNGIKVDYFNTNPEIKNTVTGCFDRKFYYSILIDDKAGFDPAEWPLVKEWFLLSRNNSRRIMEIDNKNIFDKTFYHEIYVKNEN